MKKIFLPPVAPLVLLYALCILVAIDDLISPVNYINGAPDNSPLRAAMIIPFLSPFIYAYWVFINTIDYLIGRATPSLPWLSTLAITLGLGGLQFGVIFPNGNSQKETPILAMWAFAIAAIQVIPMGFWRRRIETKKKAELSVPGCTAQDAPSPEPRR